MKSRKRKSCQRFGVPGRNPLAVFKQRKRLRKGLTIERLEDRLVFSADPTGAQLAQSISYSTDTLQGALTTVYRESQWAQLQAAYSSASSFSDVTRSLPNDPLFADQWHLLNTAQEVGNPDLQNLFGVAGQDINVVPVWNTGITGNGVLVAVIDSGVQTSHPDLIHNINPALEYNAITGTTSNVGPDGFDPEGFHGTAVAGIIGATANNGIGGSGVAPGATIVPIKLIANGQTDQATLNAFAWAMNNGVDITNNSWGPPDTRQIATIDPNMYDILRSTVINGRDGLGMINVWASGNGGAASSTFPFGSGGYYDSSSYDPYANSRYVITVTGVDHDGLYLNADGTYTSYPEAGPNVLVAAPTGSNSIVVGNDNGYGSGIWTTDLTGDQGANSAPLPSGFDPDNDPLSDPNYTSRFNGTSAAAPMVSGVIALMLEANPNLTYRDVQEILVRSAKQNAQFESPSSGVQSTNFLTSKNTWITNQLQPFNEVDPYSPQYNYRGFNDPIADPAQGFPFGFDLYAPDSNDGARQFGSTYEPQPPLYTNGAGYTVSQGYGIYSEAIGYGHGEVDADLAVKMAQQWSSLNQNIAPGTERTYTTGSVVTGSPIGNIPAAEKGSQESGYWLVPGGLDSTSTNFIEYYNQFFVDNPFQDYTGPGPGARGDSYVDFAVPPAQGIDVEWVEVRMALNGPGTAMDGLRIFLTSPEGTQSEFNNFYVSPSLLPASVQSRTTPTWSVDPAGDLYTGDSLLWTWSTNRSWGESSNSSAIIHAATGEPVLDANGQPIFRNWELHVENWSGSPFYLSNLEVVWHGKPISGGTFDPNYGQQGAASAQRIQGFVGIDTNGDEQFNYSRYVQTISGTHTDVSTIRASDIQRQLDFVDANHNGILDYGLDANGKFGPLETITQEPFAANIVVQARRVFNGVAEATPIAQFLTGADGNYYFDLNVQGDKAYAASIGATLEYEISVVDPEHRALLEDVDTPALTTSDPNYTYLAHYKQSWRITPDWFYAPDHDNPAGQPLGNNPGEIFYDPTTKAPVAWTNDGALPRVPMAVQNINFLLKQDAPPDQFNVNGTVYADLNANGVFDGNDSPAANIYVYLDGNRDGVPEPSEPRFQTDAYGHYSITIQTSHPDTFAIGVIRPTNEWLFTDPGNDGIQEIYAGPGAADQVANFFLFPPNDPNPGGGSGPGNIRGVVFNDLDNNGARGLAEVGVPNIRVYVDSNQNGVWDSGTEDSQLTSDNGSFAFSIVNPGTVRINVDIADKGTPAAFWNVTTPSLGYFDVTIGAGGNVNGLEFGLNSRADSDWGDLPDSYGTTAATNGPRHHITPGFQLGPSVDGEVDGKPTADATGEALAGDDDNGVLIVSNGGSLVKGDNTLRITVSGIGGLLTGWMDFNADGHFDETERLTWRLNGANLGGEADINPGTYDFTITVPSNAVGNKIASRFRWGEQGLSFLGPAAVGEVEDYMFTLVSLLGDYNQDGIVNQADYSVWRKSNGQTVTPFSGADGNGDGVVGPADFEIWRAHFGETAATGAGAALVADGANANSGSLAGAAAFASNETVFGAAVGLSSSVPAAAYGLRAYQPSATTNSIVVSPAVAAVVASDSISAASLAFDAFVLDDGASSSSSSVSTGTPVLASTANQSTANANLLLVDLAIGDMNDATWNSADMSIQEDSHSEVENASDLALAAVMSDDNNWWNGV